MGKEKTLEEYILEPKAEFWEYKFTDENLKFGDFQIAYGKMHRAINISRFNSPQHKYYACYFNKKLHYICVNDSKKYIHVYDDGNQAYTALEYEKYSPIIKSKVCDARKELDRIHKKQKIFQYNWVVLIIITILDLYFCFIAKRIDTTQLSMTLTYGTLIIIIEDAFTILSKRFIQRNLRIGSQLYFYFWIVIELLCFILTFMSNLEISTLTNDILTFIAGVMFIISLRFRKDTFSLI